MSRQLEQEVENRSHKRHLAIVSAVEYGLTKGVERAGGQLTGLAVKYNGSDCLVVVKAILAGRSQVAFVGGEDLGTCLVKAAREAGTDKLKWRDDKYGGQS